MHESPAHTTQLEDRLVMRGATRADATRLADFNAEMHSDPDEPLEWIWNWTHDLLSKPHPTLTHGDIILVEDTDTGQIVSSCVYFQENWSYRGIPVPFGRPELVSTHPDYRNRGLIRRQFELMHRWGDERGHLVQGITGIPYYYRQFGYEMALEMGRKRTGQTSKLPSWKNGEVLTLSLRRAERSDVPFMLEIVRRAQNRSLFTPDVTAESMEYQLFDRDEKSMLARTPYIVENNEKERTGFTVSTIVPEFDTTNIVDIEFVDLSMFRTHTKPLLQALKETLEALAEREGKTTGQTTFDLSNTNPAHPFIGSNFVASGNSYAWYMRTPSIPKLLKLIAPKLDERLVGTVFEGLTGDKVLNFYRGGVGLKFEDGRITSVDQVKFHDRKKSMASLPDLTFLQLLFGRRSVSDLSELMVDARATSDEDTLLMDTLFPRMPSDTRLAIG